MTLGSEASDGQTNVQRAGGQKGSAPSQPNSGVCEAGPAVLSQMRLAE